MKKQYPQTVMMRKRLVFIAAIGLALLITLIIYNLWHDNTHARQPAVAAPSPALLPDTATTLDTAWFKSPKTAAPAIQRTQPAAAHPLPLHLPSIAAPIAADIDQHAIQAPINSNQIRVESKETQAHNAETISTANHVKDPISAPEADSSAEKKTFLSEAAHTHLHYLTDTLQNPLSPYEIKTGAIIPAILISGINSDLPGPITAQVRENIYDTIAGRYLLIPQGAKLQGVYDSAVAYGQQRVLIAWQRLIFPNGQSLGLAGMPGTDVSGYAGFNDQTNNHYERLFGSALMMSMISAGLQLSQPRQSNDNASQPSVNQILAQNIGISLSQTTDQLLRKNINIQPTLEIRPGYLFNVTVTQDMLFPGIYNPQSSFSGPRPSPS